MAKERRPNGLMKLLNKRQVAALNKEIKQKGPTQAALDRGVTWAQLRYTLSVDPVRCSEKVYNKMFPKN